MILCSNCLQKKTSLLRGLFLLDEVKPRTRGESAFGTGQRDIA
jgi:hypothetical protein